MKIGFKNDIGKKRKTNEDSFYINEKLCLFIVADGMGGCQGGEVASHMAVETVSEYIIAREPLPSDREDVYNIIMGAIYKANEDIRLKAENDTDLEGMGTTIVSALCCKKHFCISHVGDSRAYLIGDGEIKQLTEDHSKME